MDDMVRELTVCDQAEALVRSWAALRPCDWRTRAELEIKRLHVDLDQARRRVEELEAAQVVAAQEGMGAR